MNKITHWVAFSGGVDSQVLLHLLCTEFKYLNLQAVHINHQLLPDAKSWEKHCKSVCKKLHIPLDIIRVNIQKNPGDSLEAKARDARYSAFKKIMKTGDVLFTAHHQDDQAETVLLQLFRGAGLRGVSAMPALSQLGNGFLARPLLDFSQQNLLDYAKTNKLHWVDDPSNNNTKFDRNYLRHDIFPLLKKRWPKINKILTRFAAHCAEQEEILDNIAKKDLSMARQKNMLRVLIREKGHPVPPEKVLTEIMNMQHAKQDAHPKVEWQGVEYRRINNTKDFNKIIVSNNTEVKFRQGGEKFKPKNSKQSKTLKKLFQEWKIPAWERDKIPLIYYNGELIAIIPPRPLAGEGPRSGGEGV